MCPNEQLGNLSDIPPVQLLLYLVGGFNALTQNTSQWVQYSQVQVEAALKIKTKRRHSTIFHPYHPIPIDDECTKAKERPS